MNSCPDCGSENRPEARFCRSCGFPFPLPEDFTPSLGNEPALLDALPNLNPLINERFRIRQELETSPEGIIYEAEDLLSCWSCRELQPAGGQQFCQNCGAEMAIAPLVRLRATPIQPAEGESPPEGSFSDGGYDYVVVAEEPVAEAAPEPVGVRLESGFQSHPGGVRENNEDSLIALHLSGICEKGCPTALGLFAVADGVGGSESGELASKAAIEGLAASIMQNVFLPELLGSPIARDLLSIELKKSVEAANQSVFDIQSRIGNSEMGCTMTVALIRDRQAIIANVGDSRTYLMRADSLERVTQDHSLVARMVEQGVLQEEEVYSHQYRNVILRSLGFQMELDIDIYELELNLGDRLLLCSDGLWETLRDPMIEDILLEQRAPQPTCDRLLELTVDSGDNVSMIIVKIQA